MDDAGRSTSRAYDFGDLETLLSGAGAAGDSIAGTDWARSPVGAPEHWPASLRWAVAMCLPARSPLAVFWGPELAIIYNSASIPLLGGKHPSAMGTPGSECLAELWPTIGPMLEGVLLRGESSWSHDLLLPLERHGYVEETYFELSFSPVRDDSGNIGGVLGVAMETTTRVLGERRLVTVGRLGEASGARSAEAACARAASLMTQSPASDLPFALLYLVSEDGLTARLAGTSRIPAGSGASPEVVELSGRGDAAWPLGRVAARGEPELVEVLPEPARRLEIPLLEGLPIRGRPRGALVLPIGRDGQMRPAGLMVAGISPWRELDAEYRAFFSVVAGQVATAVAGARAYQVERDRAETLAQVDQAKTALLSDVSHEFRTPLTLLIGLLEDSMADPLGMASEQLERVEVAHRNALRLLKLVNALLDFSRIEAGRVRPVLEPIDLAAVTAELAGYFRSTVERGGVRLLVDCPPLPQPALADREMWDKIVLNLISNAFKFTLEGEIRVVLRARPGEFVLTVSDTGTGIPADELSRIFDRFERVVRDGARTREGTGIGLALVDQLVKLLGGTLGVTSKVGAGTTFTVRLPALGAALPEDGREALRHQAPALLGATSYVEEAVGWLPDVTAQWTAEAPAVIDAGRAEEGGTITRGDAMAPRVLVVDDNADMRGYLGHLLERYWTVEMCADGTSALAAALARPPALVLTDVMMPGVDGLGLLRALRDDERTAHVPVVIVSARTGPEAIVEGLEAGADDYLLKPFSARELIARVRGCLVRVQLNDELAGARAEASLGRARRDFMNMAAHELRSPLTVMAGYLSMLRDGTIEPDSDHFAGAIEAMQGKVAEASALVEHVLIAARLEAGRLVLRRAPLDLREQVVEAVGRARPLADIVGEHLHIHVPDAGIKVTADRRYVGRILDNLIRNALTHGTGGGVWVTLASEGEAVVRVRDAGRGVAAGMRERIFEPFVRGDEHMSGAGGTGLGLSISRRLAEAHGGTVTLEDRPGPGATFVLRMPMEEPR